MIKNWFIFLIIFLSGICSLSAQEYELPSNEYMKGYIYGKLEERFPCAKIEFDIQDYQIIVSSWPNELSCEELQTFLENFPPYSVVFNKEHIPGQYTLESTTCYNPPFDEGDFLPEINFFFPTLLAQPHIIGYSVGYRSYEKMLNMSCLPISIGDQFSLFQFKSVHYGHLYFGIEACVWAIFEARTKSLSLINADYFVALPFTYLNDRFSARFRIYHQSSHLGDEFLLENDKIVRYNPSMEVADLSFAYEFNKKLTTFIGYSTVLRSDDGFKIKPNMFYYGFNFYMTNFIVNFFNGEATPYFSTYFTNLEDNDWRLETSLALGYQWTKSYGHKLRIYLEGKDGYSPDGQFSKQRTRYIALKLLYGY